MTSTNSPKKKSYTFLPKHLRPTPRNIPDSNPDPKRLSPSSELQLSLFQIVFDHNVSAQTLVVENSSKKLINAERSGPKIEGKSLVSVMATHWRLSEELENACGKQGVFILKVWTREHYLAAPKANLKSGKFVTHTGGQQSWSDYMFLDGIPYKIREKKAPYDPENKSPSVILSFRKHPALPIGYVLVKSYTFSGNTI